MIHLDRKRLLASLGEAKAFMAKKVLVPWMSLGLFEVEDGCLFVSVSDGSAFAKIRICEVEGEIAPFAVAIADLVSRLSLVSSSTMSVELEDTTATVKCGPAKYRVPRSMAEHVPALPDCPGATSRVNASLSAQPIRAALSAAATGADRPHLNGVFLSGDRVVGVDGHRLHCLMAPVGGATGFLPRSIAEWVASRADGEVEVAWSKTRVRADHGGSSVVCGLPEGAFPPSAPLIGLAIKATKSTLTADREALAAAIGALNSGEAERTNTCTRFETRGETMLLTEETSLDQSTCVVDGMVKEPFGSLPRYMLEAISAIGGSRIEIASGGSLDALVVRVPGTTSGSICVVMPRRLK